MDFIWRTVVPHAQRMAIPYAKRYGIKFGRWCLAHKAMIVVCVLLFYILFSQLNLDRRIAASLGGFGPLAYASAPSETTPSPTSINTAATTQPAATQPAEGQVVRGLGGVEIDNSPGLPVSLDSDRIKGLITDVDHLQLTMTSTVQQLGEHVKLETDLLADDAIQKLWNRLGHGGFRDRQLPLDWYECVQDDISFAGQLNSMATTLLISTAFDISSQHLQTVRGRILGAKPTFADLEFIRLTQDWVNVTSGKLGRALPLMRQVIARMRVEFASLEYGPQQQQPPQQQMEENNQGLILPPPFFGRKR